MGDNLASPLLLEEAPTIASSCQSSKRFFQVICGVVLFLLTTVGVWYNSFPRKSCTWEVNKVFNQKPHVFNDSKHTDNQYNEISISYFTRNRSSTFSKFYCTGSENDLGDWASRLCIFQKICYAKDLNLFYYYRSSDDRKKPLFYDSRQGMLYQFDPKNVPSPFVALSAGGGIPWSPVVTSQAYPNDNVTRLKLFHVLTQSRFATSNIAHGIWEDFGSISYSMDRMNIIDRDVRIMHHNEFLTTSLTKMYYENIIPALTNFPLVQFSQYMQTFPTKFICFDNLLAGGQLSVFPKPLIKENHGREALFYHWRSKIIKFNRLDPSYVPTSHRIVLVNKSQSIWTKPGSSKHRAIANLEEVEKFVRATYKDILVEVVEWHLIPFREQLVKLLNTTILITPCGGVSLIIPFLPHGAHAIVMDYYVDKALHGFNVGESGSMEGALLNHIPHVKKQYYQIYGKADYEWDYPGANDAREASSIVVNTTRLHVLMDKALEEMEP